MGTNTNQDRLLPFANSIIRRKARLLAGRYGLGESDTEDISQSLVYEVLSRSSRFDPSKGSEAQFVSTVVRNAIATLVERQKTAKRLGGAVFVWLDADIKLSGGDSVTIQEDFDKEAYLQATCSSNTFDARLFDLCLDLERAFSSLPPDLRHLAEQLHEMTPTEIAQMTGIPRTTVNERIKKLRSHMLQAGFDKYLKKSPSDRGRFR